MEFSFGQPHKYKSVVVQLGRIGDILNIIPACVAADCQNILVCRRYLELFSGFSYLRPLIWDGDIQDLEGAVKAASQATDTVLIPQLFQNNQAPPDSLRKRSSFVMDEWDAIQTGLGDKWGTLPLIVNTRGIHEIRCIEEKALRCCNYDLKRRMLIVCLESHSSPYPYAEELRRYLRCHWQDKFEIVDLYRPLPRFLDLLGLMGWPNQNFAAGMICIDTAPLHLARAVPALPVFQIHRDGEWLGTPKIGPQATCQPYTYNKWDRLGEWLRSLETAPAYLSETK